MPGITDPAEGYFKDGIWGWDASQWQKLALLWGYTDVYSEVESDTNADVGSNYLTFSTVPSGEVWVVTNVVAFNATTAGSSIGLRALVGGVDVLLRYTLYSTPTRYIDWHGKCVLQAGDYIKVGFFSCVALDDIYAYACGYKMAVS